MMTIPKKMIKEWCGSFDAAVDLIYSVLNNETDKDDIIFDMVIKPVWDKMPFGKK